MYQVSYGKPVSNNRPKVQHKEIAADVDAYIAAGGKITEVPGFTKVAPITKVEQILTPHQAPELWKPIPAIKELKGLAGYLVNRQGNVWSKHRNQMVVPWYGGKVQLRSTGIKSKAYDMKELAAIVWGEA